jgi:putative transposase
MGRGIERRKIFLNTKDRNDFIARLGQLAEERSMDVHAWALLPNHAHILLRSGPKGLSGFMRRLLSGYAISYNIRHKRYGHIYSRTAINPSCARKISISGNWFATSISTP